MRWEDKSDFAKDLNNRPLIIGQFLNRVIDSYTAAERLQLSRPRIYALATKARRKGLNSLTVLGQRGTPINERGFKPEFKKKIVDLYTSYQRMCSGWNIVDCSFKIFLDTLKEKHNIQLSYSALHALLTAAGKVSPYAHRKKKEKTPILIEIEKQKKANCG